MAYFNTCQWCGSNLDPGERCDCQRIRVREREEREKEIQVRDGGQYCFKFVERAG